MSDAIREARIRELRNLIKQGEYRIDAQQTAARLLDEHLAGRATSEENALSAAASAPSPATPPK
jgi:hypothetical protein